MHYLNTDFEIESARDVSRIIEELGGDVSVLFHGQIKGHHAASFNVASMFIGADEAINYFCDLIEQFPKEVRDIWNNCVSRVIDIGYESDESPTNYRTELRSSTIHRVSGIGASIVVTLYPMAKDGDKYPHS